MSHTRKLPKYEITADGISVWVNTATGNIARFSVMGIDIHRSFVEQAAGTGECLYCTHGKVTEDDWETFKVEMLRHYGVVVSDRYRPKRFVVNEFCIMCDVKLPARFAYRCEKCSMKAYQMPPRMKRGRGRRVTQ